MKVTREFYRLHACLPLAGIGSLCGTPNSISLYSWYKLGISAMHFNVRPLVVVGGVPWKCELCSCNLRLIRVATKLSDVCMNCCSAEYCWNRYKKRKIGIRKYILLIEKQNTGLCINEMIYNIIFSLLFQHFL